MLNLGIPGPWTSPDALARAIGVAGQSRYAIVGETLTDLETQDSVPIELHQVVEKGHLERAFETGGQGTISKAVIKEVAAATHIAFVRFPVDVYEQERLVAAFTAVLQRAGGLAIKVESSGVAHEFPRWQSLMQSGQRFAGYHAIVALVRQPRGFYSCGMHCFDLEDAVMEKESDLAYASDLLHQFNCFRLFSRPDWVDDHIFGLTDDGPKYRLKRIEDTQNARSSPPYNPRGRWMLTRA